ncbi:MAG TPA: hypothetical protein VK447_16670 [Myxococcaceae bacterium]|nr:hypothetical protein [Myxococcaceae bacterium]
MAVELLVMPLSRYWAGDYLPLGMQRALELKAPHQYRPPARRFSRFDLREPEAAERARRERALLLEKRIPDLIQSFPPDAQQGWNEMSSQSKVFELEQAQYEEVLMDAQDASFDHLPHLISASIFLPPHFVRVFELHGLQFGSLPLLAGELRKVPWSTRSEAAAGQYLSIVNHAIELKLPLFVDL